MRRKKKRKGPLPRRDLRRNRAGRLQTASAWLAALRGRPVDRLLRAYRARYGVDWECAVQELTKLGVTFDPQWIEERKRALAAERRARARKTASKGGTTKKAKKVMTSPDDWPIGSSDGVFSYIAGYTGWGYPYGVTWEQSAAFAAAEASGQLFTVDEMRGEEDGRSDADDDGLVYRPPKADEGLPF